MGRLVAAMVWVAASLEAQAIEDLLLPEVRRIAGTVVDLAGRPVAGARIDHSDSPRQTHQTDAAGRFELSTRAPVLVIRKPGYRSGLVRTRDADEPAITLRPLESMSWPCRLASTPATRESCRTAPHPSIPTYDPRCAQARKTGVFIQTKSGPKGIRHGSGPMWSLGTPRDREVWRSVEFEEVTYDFEGQTIIDARGQLPDGQWWRYLGMFGESASYSVVDPAAAKVLDKVLDACAELRPHQR